MAGVPFIFGNATTSIPLSNLDANFNTGLTIGNTTVGLGNTVTTLGNVTLNNATVSSTATALPYASLPTGSVLQVVNATYSSTVTNATQTLIDTGLTATITPKFATSKILIIVNQNGVTADANGVGVTLSILRNASLLEIFFNYAAYSALSTDTSVSKSYLDTPATTSATTYKTPQQAF